MTETAGIQPKCGRCGAELPANPPEGLCPRCVIALNFSTETDIPTAAAGPGGTPVTKPSPQPPLPPADLAKLFPQLEILGFLGRGGMGAVYKARQPRLDRIVALKILSPEKERDAQFGERFAREARTLAKLNHPNIVTVYDFGEVEGRFFLLMEFVDGLSLRQLLHSRRPSPEEALAIVPKICEALQYAHQRGIVHRDIKPENILMDKEGQVKIADFGIARMLGHQPTARLTEEKQVIGTPHYMAPEQVEKPQLVDHRADIYSLGVVFYEMLTGELPLGRFAAPSRKVQMDIRLDEVVLRALEKEPELRYQQASDVKQEVETIAVSTGTKSGSTAVSPREPARGGFRLVAVAAALVLLAIAAFLLLPYVRPGATEMRMPAPDAAEIGRHLRGAKRQISPTRLEPLLPKPAVSSPPIDIEGFLAEVPADFRPAGKFMDHNSLRRESGVRVLNAPRLRVLSGSWAELTIADIPVANPARSFTFRAHTTLDRGKVNYDLEVIDNLKRLAPDSSATNLFESTRNFKSSGVAEMGSPQSFELGTLDNHRRLIAVLVFRPGTSADSPEDSPQASISNPEFQQVINLRDTDRNGIVFFDFETGRLVKSPTTVNFDPDHPTLLSFSPELREWIQREDLDVMFVLKDIHWHAISLDLDEQVLRNPANPESFTTGELEALLSSLAGQPVNTNNGGNITASVFYLTYSDKARAPAAVFRTRQGTLGLFKWTSVADPQPGVKVRYRFGLKHETATYSTNFGSRQPPR